MKFLRTSLALIALIALMLPCAHLAHHHAPDAETAERCLFQHAECHACHGELCSKSANLIRRDLLSSTDVPERQVVVLRVLSLDRPAAVRVSNCSGVLQHLQTIQLLI